MPPRGPNRLSARMQGKDAGRSRGRARLRPDRSIENIDRLLGMSSAERLTAIGDGVREPNLLGFSVSA
jgi:hypothetical protein